MATSNTLTSWKSLFRCDELPYGFEWEEHAITICLVMQKKWIRVERLCPSNCGEYVLKGSESASKASLRDTCEETIVWSKSRSSKKSASQVKT
ncbi:unnamed protein product [Eruca vesicaria subsp. sativa]|uniref:Uncharacterized protein n=1 Tax=Eruca vesicaria subsp. sativa TaxID=29727 RepID=A0ABC8IPK4_ERUVS|nr:unnamed protein product [Eruca vesicaria subsp. sativa]